uniref:Uncharacterized protein AlNc14C114G6473 n=1 Tax=Albugo laibachii Nc14 TaxID=890382 RepID=F0WIT8_9STRA|nr:conserved hypothetical protein [Albugo laibachii Nc14]|eukprot:CCA21182.1 conserved hypothetical protein [Albugo laibachii Nc14]
MTTFASLRELEKARNKKPDRGYSVEALLTKGLRYALKGWKAGGRLTWIITTTMLITLVPLSIELLREEQTNEIVKELLNKGYTFNQIQGMGYHVQTPPSTLSTDIQGSTM